MTGLLVFFTGALGVKYVAPNESLLGLGTFKSSLYLMELESGCV